ncbi:hypothetical protein LOD99_6253 [Oopsacas minuta]|uniref:Uncharacterized protein n=1 Tax=Oopsacas minuta TaxID=111878 RepID=A0AAV7JM50_9METZ|nr:hypothetical protein LOD99_6253 [Oopsacas minuta]
MCQEAYRFGPKKHEPQQIRHKSVGRLVENSPQQFVKLCNKCFLKVGRGIRHECSSSNAVTNTRHCLDSSSLNKSASSSVPSVSLELSDMLQIKTEGNLSNNDLKSVISILRGLDFGQGFLKVTIQPELSNSVCELAIIWLSPVPENYHNLKSIYSSHEIRRLILDLNISLTIDIKAALIAFGIMPGRHPCPWCTWDERNNLDDIEKWELRGSTQHAAQYEEFCREYGGLKENSKLCKGVDNPTVFQDADILPIENMVILNLAELHLLLGVSQILYDVIVESMSEDEIQIHQDTLKSHHHFNKVWRRYTFDEDTEGYGEGLFNAVCEFNFISLTTDNAADVWKGYKMKTRSSAIDKINDK